MAGASSLFFIRSLLIARFATESRHTLSVTPRSPHLPSLPLTRYSDFIKGLQKHASPGIIMALVGNKADLHEKRDVSSKEAAEYAEKNGMFFIETSAKDNINQLFEEIARLPRPTPYLFDREDLVSLIRIQLK